MSLDNLLIERDGTTAILTLHRPSVLNALNLALLDDLRRALDDVAADERVRAVVITGTGDKAFAAGADIRELHTLTPLAAREHALTGQAVITRLATLSKPTIAAINGFALGGGCELALACTLRIAASTARLGQPEITLGLLPGFGGTQRLPRLVGAGVALDLLLTGRQVTADEALRIGLVNRVVAPEALRAEALQLAAELGARAPAAVAAILETVREGIEMPLDAALRHEATRFGLLASTADMHEGTTAFLEKRRPVFTGR